MMRPYDIDNRIPITPKQKNLLDKISERSQGDGWCAVEDLAVKKTITKMTALNRNLRELEQRGLVERRLDHRSREYVKLKHPPSKERLYNLYAMND